MFQIHVAKQERKTIKKRLSSGQTIALTPQDEKMVKTAYERMQGYSKKTSLQSKLLEARDNLEQLENALSSDARDLLDGVAVQSSRISVTATPSLANYRKDNRSVVQKEIDEYVTSKNEFLAIEEKFNAIARMDYKISSADVEELMRHLGVINIQAKALNHMIYEVDELVDGVICWDEFQLCYYRNINDKTGNEPSTFFRLMEFVMFDPQQKGVIQEDDVMEILFSRIGAAKLEEELLAIYGNNLRARGGIGTITLAQYLSSCVRKSGRRALLA